MIPGRTHCQVALDPTDHPSEHTAARAACTGLADAPPWHHEKGRLRCPGTWLRQGAAIPAWVTHPAAGTAAAAVAVTARLAVGAATTAALPQPCLPTRPPTAVRRITTQSQRPPPARQCHLQANAASALPPASRSPTNTRTSATANTPTPLTACRHALKAARVVVVASVTRIATATADVVGLVTGGTI